MQYRLISAQSSVTYYCLDARLALELYPSVVANMWALIDPESFNFSPRVSTSTFLEKHAAFLTRSIRSPTRKPSA